MYKKIFDFSECRQSGVVFQVKFFILVRLRGFLRRSLKGYFEYFLLQFEYVKERVKVDLFFEFFGIVLNFKDFLKYMFYLKSGYKV